MKPKEIAAVLLPVLIDEYGGTEEDWTGMRSLKRVSQAVAALMPVATEVVESPRDVTIRGSLVSHKPTCSNVRGNQYLRPAMSFDRPAQCCHGRIARTEVQA